MKPFWAGASYLVGTVVSTSVMESSKAADRPGHDADECGKQQTVFEGESEQVAFMPLSAQSPQ